MATTHIRCVALVTKRLVSPARINIRPRPTCTPFHCYLMSICGDTTPQPTSKTPNPTCRVVIERIFALTHRPAHSAFVVTSMCYRQLNAPTSVSHQPASDTHATSLRELNLLLLLIISSPLVGAAGLKFDFGHDEYAFDFDRPLANRQTSRLPVGCRIVSFFVAICKLRNFF